MAKNEKSGQLLAEVFTNVSKASAMLGNIFLRSSFLSAGVGSGFVCCAGIIDFTGIFDVIVFFVACISETISLKFLLRLGSVNFFVRQ